MQIAPDKVVRIHYTVTNDGGEVIDKTTEEEGFSYLHGANNIIPGLEAALVGKSIGDHLNVTIPPTDAYGVRNESLKQTIPHSEFPEVNDLQAGMQFHAETPEGDPIVVTVDSINDDHVIVDGNHPLAGVSLNFIVEVLDIRDATAEELSHNHAHGVGGHHHD